MKNKLLILDMDGVIIDSKKIHYFALNKALNLIDKKYQINESEHLTIYDGLPTKKKLEILSKTKGLKKKHYKFIWGKKQIFTNNLLKKLQENKNLKKNLKKIKKNKIKLALASNATKKTVFTVLNKLKIKNFFDSVMSADDVSLTKPHPEIYWKIMTNLKTVPENTLIVEDSPTGRMAANNSMCKLIEVESSKDLNDIFFDNIISIFKNNKNNIKKPWVDKNLNILIPMAGSGKRFKDAGYTFPKPLIEINGKPMIQYVIENLNIKANWIFIVQKEHYNKYNLKNLLNNIQSNCKIIITEGLTQGAACTSLLAKNLINNKKPLLIANSDQIIEWNSDEFMYFFKNSKSDGGILTFESTHPKWSYVKLNSSNLVVEVAEKNPISTHATCGVYFWKRGLDYVKYAEKMINKNIRVNNEFYICPVYNEAIKDKKIFITKKVFKMNGIGTPEDLKNFIRTT
jgi:HAD superfamily hydrolase (TIGR01509 family)